MASRASLLTTAYHGSPITGPGVLDSLLPTLKQTRHFCVSFFRPDQIKTIAAFATSFFIDNGAFSAWKAGIELTPDYWAAYYVFLALWLERPDTWFVIPDAIDAGSQYQDSLIRDCPNELLPRGWPVWHMDEPLHRLLQLIERFGRVCIGSTAEYRVVGSLLWHARMTEAFNAISATFGIIPPVHMLRGLQCLEWRYPFTSVDSTNIARNHNRLKGLDGHYLWGVVQMANRWDRLNCPAVWLPKPVQAELLLTG